LAEPERRFATRSSGEGPNDITRDLGVGARPLTSRRLFFTRDLLRYGGENRHATAWVQTRGQIAQESFSAENSSFTAMRSAWKRGAR